MPSKAALAAVAKIRLEHEKETATLSEADLNNVLVDVEQRVNEIIARGTIYNETAENEVVKFDLGGMCFNPI